MTRLMLALATAVTGSHAALPAAASPRQAKRPIIIYGNDPCPEGARQSCVSAKAESDRYRLPKDQQLRGTRQQTQSWARRSQPLATVGATGPQSCSASVRAVYRLPDARDKPGSP